MIDVLTLPPTDQAFTHIDRDTGARTVFAVTRLRAHCDHHLCKLWLTPIEHQAAAMIYKLRGIEKPRLLAAAKRRHFAPLLYTYMPDNTHLLVDGSHTYLAKFMRHDKWALAYIVPHSVWRDFVIHDFLTHHMTEAEILRSHSGIK